MKRREDTHRRVAAASAAVSREKYRETQTAKGLVVGPYKFHAHEPQQPDEDRDAYEKRLHRDRMRTRRGVDPATVRPRLDLSEMTDEERVEHRKRLARERKAKQRSRAQERKPDEVSVQGGPLDPEWGIF